ncbi:alkaline phosphatase [Parapedobacter lycopersici]|uniref:alkaline phosphatase n=1 Tax=Parapedobacter lycopersici TaxID=1864939 RepID=UPI00214D7CCB|nr:alkaline phosphatase [Parapedobacter lycopersici]
MKQKVKKAKNVIVMIGDGMSAVQIYAGLTASKVPLNLEQFSYIGFSKTNSTSYVTDSGAGATAISTGHKTNNGAIGVDSLDNPVPTILEIAEAHGLTTGLVATTSITDATPASFVAHQPKRSMQQEIAADFLKSGVDVFIGAGMTDFTDRTDGRNLVDELRQNGYLVATDMEEIIGVNAGKLAGFLPERSVKERGDQLARTAMTAINIVNRNKDGFFLLIEGSKIDDGGHANDVGVVIDEMIDFDQTIGKVLEFARKDKHTLIVITGDHETGGLTLTDGDLATGRVKAEFSTEDHTAVMVPVFAYGPGAEAFTGIYHNNTIFDKLLAAFGFRHQNEKQ